MSQIQTTYNQDHGILELCSSVYGIDPVSLRRIFLLLTRNHYADPTFFGNVPESFKQFRYSDDSGKSGVNIELDYTFDPDKSEQPTAIYVGVGDVSSEATGLGSFESMNSDMSGKTSVYTDICNIELSHIASTGDAALQMGVITKAFFQGMRELVCDRLGLRKYDIVRLTKPNTVRRDGSQIYFQVDVIIRIGFSNVWETLVESHRIKRVNTEIF